jgi:hypothetical protein
MSAVCSDCRKPAIAFAVVGDLEYCWRCYGVAEQRTAAKAVSTTSAAWEPPPGETHASKAEVGSFDRPPPEERRSRPARGGRPDRVAQGE